MTTIDRVKFFLGNERISLNSFKELCFVSEISGLQEESLVKILKWFRFLQTEEIPGWRTKEVTKKIAKLLISNSESSRIQFYALFCPSYKKGGGIFKIKVPGPFNLLL